MKRGLIGIDSTVSIAQYLALEVSSTILSFAKDWKNKTEQFDEQVLVTGGWYELLSHWFFCPVCPRGARF